MIGFLLGIVASIIAAIAIYTWKYLKTRSIKNDVINKEENRNERIEDAKEAQHQLIDRSSWNLEKWGSLYRDRIYFSDDDRTAKSEEIRRKLLNYNGGIPQYFRITGAPGIGKTRFAFESVKESNVKYFENPDCFYGSKILNIIEDNRFEQNVIVIDECNHLEFDKIIRSIGSVNISLSIITIFPDGRNGGNDGVYPVYELNRFSYELMAKFVDYLLPDNLEGGKFRIVRFVDGFPRFAELICESIKINPDFNISSVTDEALFHKLIAGKRNLDSAEADLAENVLQCFSILSRTPFYNNDQLSIKPIAVLFDMWNETEGKIKEEARKEVYRQKERKILQGERYLYVSPQPLQIYLLRKWAKSVSKIDLQNLFNQLQQDNDLLQKFLDNIGYLGDEPNFKEVVEELLSMDGPFSNGELIRTTTGAEFFMRIVEVAPEYSLELLESIVTNWSDGELKDLSYSRQRIVWSLERIIIHSELFERGMKLLLRIAEHDSSQHSNNAAGTWQSMFAAFNVGTYANLELRKKILNEALMDSSNIIVQQIAVEAVRKNIYEWRSSRHIGAEFQLGKTLKIYQPERQEVENYYNWMWDIIIQCLYTNSFTARESAKNVIIQKFCQHFYSHSDVESLEVLYNDRILLKEEVTKAIEPDLKYRNIDTDLIELLERLFDRVHGSGFDSRFDRYVVLNIFPFKVTEENIVEKQGKKIEEIAKEAFANKEKYLFPRLNQLMATDMTNSSYFGYVIGDLDLSLELLDKFVASFKNNTEKRSLNFIGGYLGAVSKNNNQMFLNIMKSFSEDSELVGYVPMLIARSYYDESAIDFLLGLIEDNVFNDLNIFGVFHYSHSMLNISEEKFNEWVYVFLKSQAQGSKKVILSQYHHYYVSHGAERARPKMKLGLTLEILTKSFEEIIYNESSEHDLGYWEWSQIAKASIKIFPDSQLNLLENIFKTLRKDKIPSLGLLDLLEEIVETIFKSDPVKSWNVVKKYLIDNPNIVFLSNWFRGHKSFLRQSRGLLVNIPWENIKTWIEEDVEKRANFVAEYLACPEITAYGELPKSHARSILENYGQNREVQNGFWRLRTESWSGSEVKYRDNKINDMEKLLSTEQNLSVKSFLKSIIDAEKRSRENALIRVEKNGWN